MKKAKNPWPERTIHAEEKMAFKEIDKELGLRLRKLRKENNMTQEYVANILKINRVSLYHYESAARKIDLATLCNICGIYKVKINEVLDTGKIKEVLRCSVDVSKLKKEDRDKIMFAKNFVSNLHELEGMKNE